MHNNGWDKKGKIYICLDATQTKPVEVDCIDSC